LTTSSSRALPSENLAQLFEGLARQFGHSTRPHDRA
jgi:hypothetical protein